MVLIILKFIILASLPLKFPRSSTYNPCSQHLQSFSTSWYCTKLYKTLALNSKIQITKIRITLFKQISLLEPSYPLFSFISVSASWAAAPTSMFSLLSVILFVIGSCSETRLSSTHGKADELEDHCQSKSEIIYMYIYVNLSFLIICYSYPR